MPWTSDRVADAVNERWVSVEEVATHVGVRKESIYRWIEARALPAMKIGKLWKLKLSEVDAWVRAGGTEGNGEVRLEAPGTPAHGRASTAHTSTVLIVDDDQNTRETLRDIVSGHGYTALTAVDGLDALQLLRAEGQPRPDLILLDLAMPNLDGFGFLEEQRRDQRIASIPVIIITAGRQDDGTQGPVLRKPLDIGRLVDAIQRTISI